MNNDQILLSHSIGQSQIIEVDVNDIETVIRNMVVEFKKTMQNEPYRIDVICTPIAFTSS